ncbi:MAG TPA: hydrogen peroxide-dependent heme synthase [Pirellulaceae bacterium]
MTASVPPVPPASHPASIIPEVGWHCMHAYYEFDRTIYTHWTADERERARSQFLAALSIGRDDRPQRQQTFIVSGHKADFGMIMLDPDPLRIDRGHQALRTGMLGSLLRPTFSFVSMTEISEYVPTVEQFGRKLVADGASPDDATYQARVKAYAEREPAMRAQRLTPDPPDWPATCFYPMNKKRVPGANWFLLPYSERADLMSDHAKSGMEFIGRVSQLITVGLGLDDWEWGVTLWARNPQFLKEIVYRMRFDEASARYAGFGPFFVGYPSTPEEILRHCGITEG